MASLERIPSEKWNPFKVNAEGRRFSIPLHLRDRAGEKKMSPDIEVKKIAFKVFLNPIAVTDMTNVQFKPYNTEFDFNELTYLMKKFRP